MELLSDDIYLCMEGNQVCDIQLRLRGLVVSGGVETTMEDVTKPVFEPSWFCLVLLSVFPSNRDQTNIFDPLLQGITKV